MFFSDFPGPNQNNGNAEEAPPSDESVAAALKDIKMAIQATRVLQHQTRIPTTGSGSNPSNSNAISTSASTVITDNNADLVTSAAASNGLDDPWILREQNQTTVTSTVSSTAAAAVLSLPSAPANVVPEVISEESPKENASSEEAEEENVNEEEEEEEEDSGEEEEESEEGEEESEEGEDEEEEEEEESESEIAEERVPTPKNVPEEDLDTDQETDRLLGQQYNDDNGYYDQKVRAMARRKISFGYEREYPMVSLRDYYSALWSLWYYYRSPWKKNAS